MRTLQDQETQLIQLRDLPGPRLPSWLGFVGYWVAPDFTRKQWVKRGDRVVVNVPGLPTLLFTSSPADCKTVFTSRDSGLRLGEALRRMAPHEVLFGTEMIEWWNGENHALLRRKVTPAFNGDALRGYEQAIVAAAERRVAEWPVNEPVRFQSLMLDLARDVIMSVVFGVTESERRDRLEEALLELDEALTSTGMKARYLKAMARGGKWGNYRKMDRINAKIDAVTLDEIAYRRANPDGEERKDCLEVFLKIQAADEDNLLDDRMIAIFQRLLLIAGYETTGVTLAWVAERIVRHPDVLDELDASLARGEDAYLDAVITETMRLRPALPVTMRYAEKDFVMNDVLVPTGTVVMIYINAVHKREDVYPDPDRFDPDRFLGVRPDPNTWLPFGGGAHRCLGGAFAMFESRVLLRTILQHRRFQPETSAGEREDQHRNILLLPHNGATVTLLPR
ncbi:MAG: cytochrome P450 [Pseudonocardiaceae bacterium]